MIFKVIAFSLMFCYAVTYINNKMMDKVEKRKARHEGRLDEYI